MRISPARVAVAAILVLVWFGAPRWPGGYWGGGDFFVCLGRADLVAEFSEGRVLTHMDPWNDPMDPTGTIGEISTKPAGSYRRTGWHSFEWSQTTGSGGVSKLRFTPGWIFCRVEDLDSQRVWWGVREFNFARIMRIRRHKGAVERNPGSHPQ